jgi:hypothetical protein
MLKNKQHSQKGTTPKTKQKKGKKIPNPYLRRSIIYLAISPQVVQMQWGNVQQRKTETKHPKPSTEKTR